MKLLKQLWNKLNEKGYYPKKCETDRHCFAVITPTLARRVIVVQERPCQCKKYKNVNASMIEHINKRDEILKELSIQS